MADEEGSSGESVRDILREASGLPASVELVISGQGRVRHVKGGRDQDRGFTWCNQFYSEDGLRQANRTRDLRLPICGGCLRTLPAMEMMGGEGEGE